MKPEEDLNVWIVDDAGKDRIMQHEQIQNIVIPRAVTYRIVPTSRDNFFLITESKTEFDQPEKGLLGQHALYDPGVIVTPEPAPEPAPTHSWASPEPSAPPHEGDQN